MTKQDRKSVRVTRRDGRRIAVASVLLGAVIGLTGAAAAAIEIDTATREIGAPVLRVEDSRVLLTREEAIVLALERNLGLVVERHLQRESELGEKRSFGIYDLTATVDLQALEENEPTSSNLQAGVGATVSVFERQSWNLGVSKLVPSGGVAAINWQNSRSETNSLFATLNPSFRVDFDVSFTQPLLRNRGRDVTERGIRIARTNRAISRENFELQVLSILQQVENAYWNLVEAREQFTVAEESLALAKRLHEQNRIRVEVGTLAPLELVQSEAGVATREEQIIRARAAIGDAADRLRQLLNLDVHEVWMAEVVPETDPEMEPETIDLESAMKAALANRPEVRAKRLGQGDLEADVRYFRNQRLPGLDLQLRYGLNGLGGDLTERDFLTGEILRQAQGGYSDALDLVSEADFEGWSVSLNATVPIPNRAGRAQAALAEVNHERGEAELRELELGVMTEVRRLARAVETAAQARESARVSRRLEEENLRAEQKRYENGMSTSFQVLQIQEDLTEARQREVNAITAYRKALALFHQATGELTAKSGVEIVEE